MCDRGRGNTMFKTMLIKEMHDTLVTWRFTLSSLLLITLIPLSFLVSLDDYRQRLAGYNEATSAYQKRSEGSVNANLRAEGYRPPSPLSVFVSGIEPVMPTKAVTKRYYNLIGDNLASDGMVTVKNETILDNPLSALFGSMDFLFNVDFVLSILAFLFTFTGIAGEKELGTLRQIIANPVNRWKVLLAKITGNFLMLMIPFITATLIGAIFLSISDVFPLADPHVAIGFLAIIGVSVLFLFSMVTLGTLISASCRTSLNAIITLLMVWVFFTLVVPRVSPIVAQQFHPVISKNVIIRRIESIRKECNDQVSSHMNDIREQAVTALGLTMKEYHDWESVDGKIVYAIGKEKRDAVDAEFEKLMVPIREKNVERLTAEITAQQGAYDNAHAAQQRLAMQLSRISPVSCLTYILSAIASTGANEVDRFTDEAERFQDDFLATIKSEKSINPIIGGSTSLPVPQMTGYHHASLAEAFGDTWVDLLLLGLYTILFFAGAFVAFLKYDVR
jgi:ABC-type transport system involved in multi-copper enzyme maturation permease subunit